MVGCKSEIKIKTEITSSEIIHEVNGIYDKHLA